MNQVPQYHFNPLQEGPDLNDSLRQIADSLAYILNKLTELEQRIAELEST